MGDKILDIIASETHGKSYKTYKYCFDNAETSSIDYDDNKQITWKKYGETVPPKQAKDMREEAALLMSEKPLFTYFLDGSRPDRHYHRTKGQLAADFSNTHKRSF